MTTNQTAVPGLQVRVEPEGRREPRWRVLLTTNGYQWYGLEVLFSDEARAHRVADFLRVELAPEADREQHELDA